MELLDAIRSRKSIRGFLDKEVPQEQIREILETAVRAPSATNTQPWKIFAVSGEVLAKMKQENCEKFLAKAPGMEQYSYAYEGIYKQRSAELGKQLFQLMNIERGNREQRKAWKMRGFRYFDAPVAILLGADEQIRQTMFTEFDLGALTYSICLAAMAHGLGTCIELQGIYYPEVIKKHIQVPDDVEIFMCIAMGYPDESFPANRVSSNRASLDEVTTWYGF